jgi:hypothetical protein
VLRAPATCALVLMLVAAAGARAADVKRTEALTRAVGLTSGVPAGGPPVLYAPPPQNPQLANHSPEFRAPFNPVSGTERYVRGEYTYTDFLYDDEATTYPDDRARYGNNAADLAEFRMSVIKGGLAVRLTFTTLLQVDSTMAVVAFDADRNTGTGSATLPKDPGLPFPGTDQVLTTWGSGGAWSRWDGTGWVSTLLQVRTDLEANQITLLVPDSVARPVGRWSATLATGLHDPATGGWLAPSMTGSAISNLGFRFDEVPDPSRSTAARSGNPSTGLNAAVSAGEPTRYAHVLDFDGLRSGRTWDDIPTHGLMYRIFASRLASVSVLQDTADHEGSGNTAIDAALAPALPKPRSEREGVDRSSIRAQLLSPLQPYALYVPSGYRPGRPTKLTFSLHGRDGAYWWIGDQADGGERYKVSQFGEDRDSIVLAPAARGADGWYIGDLEYDVFEAWNDAARHFSLDPERTAVTGLSMGGYGAYRFATLYPHLFARAVSVIPGGSHGGIYVPGFTDDSTVANSWLANLRHVPVFHVADTLSESTFYPGQAQNAIGPELNGLQSLEALKYRYVFRSVVADHALMVLNHSLPEITAWLSDHRVEPRPPHVTYTRMPSNDSPGLVHDRAYWLSEIDLLDDSGPRAKGTVDAISLGLGVGGPTTPQSPTAVHGIDAGGRPYVELERVWLGPSAAVREDRIVLTATNIEALTIDPVSAGVSCDVELEIRSETPVLVSLEGCRR